MNYYRRYSGDYLRDTSRLNLTEHGAYTLMMDYYYAEEKPLPLDHEELFTMVRAMRQEDRAAVEKVLGLYFTRRVDGYHQKRIDHEIEISKSARTNGKNGGRPKTTKATEPVTEQLTGTVTEPVTGKGTTGNTGDAGGEGGGLGHPPTTNLQPPASNPQPPPKESPAEAGAPAVPFQSIVDLFNEHMVHLPKVREITAKRKNAMRGAWQAGKARQSMRFWTAYFEECSEDAFLNGTGPYGKGHENWRPDFDYLMRPDVITRTYEKALSRAS
jgi:uncharacterized protein YdaU (DUF1376 family)